MSPDPSPGPPARPHPSSRSAAARYGVAVLAVAVALGVAWGLRHWLDPNFFYVFLAAVAVAAWYGGLGPGLLATALALLPLDWLFLAPHGGFSFAPADLVKLALFAATGAAASWTSANLLDARDRARAEADESARLAGLLQEQAVELEHQAEEAQGLNEELEHQIQESHEATAALQESEARFRSVADAAPVLLWMSDTTGACIFFNQPWLDFTGRPLEEEMADGWVAGVHPDDRRRCMAIYTSSFQARRPFEMEYRLRRHDGEYRWLLDHGTPRLAPDGSFAGFIGSCVDINERREAEEQMRFLANAGTVLASSLDYEETLRRVCRLAVPVLADYCVIDLLEEEEIRRVDAVHADPAFDEVMRELVRYAPDPRSSHPVAEALRTGTPRVGNEGLPGQIAANVSDPGHRALLERLGITAYLIVPLLARGRVLGSIMLCVTTSGRRYDDRELLRAEELARRAAYAIDNARLYAGALEANRAKSDFLAVMSHELRTPLNAILGYTDLFLMGVPAALPEPVQPQMLRVQTAARHLLALIDEILTFARLEAGQEEPAYEAVPVGALMQEAAALVEPLALERGIAFHVEPPAEPLEIVTDARQARQVLVNLLGNAVKFTDRGEASLTAARAGDGVLLRVADTGIGIAPEHLERIFDPFWQAEQGLVRTRGGSGLGLAVSRQLARLLGGDLTVESAPGRGSVFTLRLPAAPGA